MRLWGRRRDTIEVSSGYVALAPLPGERGAALRRAPPAALWGPDSPVAGLLSAVVGWWHTNNRKGLDMSTSHTHTFDFSGDLEWARWHRGAACVACKEDGTEVAAVGVAVSTGIASVDVRPVCLDHADGSDVFPFEAA